jgi:hypothetical protein
MRLPIKPPAAEQSAPVTGPKKIPERGKRAALREKVLPVPDMGIVGSICPMAIIAAHTAITAGCVLAGTDGFRVSFSFAI